ncbi:MAG: DEAD/DEAH box helicase [Armatimonadetes bacterium]|nr:DEAD/DEAH box helicase [Armatimonadota bacterium]
MDFAAFIHDLTQSPEYSGQIEHVRHLPGHPARFRELRHELQPSVRDCLRELGIQQLWSHQAEAIDRILDGEHVVVVSSTASGKTLCYTVPMAQRLSESATSRTLVVYPTKALAQDQLRKLEGFGAGRTFTAETYDGDTPPSIRRRIKRECHVVLTNPDMLHVGILPYHHTWADFFRHLCLVVLDEVHVYRGVFGSHTANVIRRLRRIARHYGSDPQFVCCSATIANPKGLCDALTGLDFSLVDDDGAPQGNRTFVLWNPPVLDRKTARRRSANLEAADLLIRLMRRDVRTICFTLARVQAELILRYVRQRLEGSELADKILAYRGGYLPSERRAIEQRLFDGDLLAVTSTTALELGVDIGGLDAAILAGYPGSVASTRQQAGRAGRGKQDALAVLIGMPGGIHQYLMRHPEYILENTSERAIIDPFNRFILGGHLLCAAYELAISERDRELFGPEMDAILEILAEHRYVTLRGSWYWIDPTTYPAREINIRSAGGPGYDIVLRRAGQEDILLGTMDDASAFRLVHPGAIYLHAGQTYLVETLDLEKRVATVVPTDARYYTVPLTAGDVRIDEEEDARSLPGGATAKLGRLQVKSAVLGFTKREQITERELGREDLDLPPSSYETVGAWITLSRADVEAIQSAGYDLMGTIHALEHAIIQLLPLVALCDPHDVAGSSNLGHPDVADPTVFMWDSYPGGVGICETGYERLGELMAATAETIAACPCEDGCPSCVQAPDCGNANQPLSKAGAILLARRLSGASPPSNDAA